MSKRLLGLALAVAALAAQAGSLRFDDVFDASGAASPLHYRALYRAGGSEHGLEMWRDATRLKRVTDGAVETHVERTGADFTMTVLDLRRHVATRIDRDSLYRLGNFTDWFDLAHALRHPRGEYRLSASAAPAPAPATVAACRWYELAQQGAATQMCWSADAQLPLLIVDAGGQVVWRVTELQPGPVRASVFAVHDEGFVRNDAREDLERD